MISPTKSTSKSNRRGCSIHTDEKGWCGMREGQPEERKCSGRKKDLGNNVPETQYRAVEE